MDHCSICPHTVFALPGISRPRRPPSVSAQLCDYGGRNLISFPKNKIDLIENEKNKIKTGGSDGFVP
jgi:hypothetical protein